MLALANVVDLLADEFAGVLGTRRRASTLTDAVALQLLRHQSPAKEYFLELRKAGRGVRAALNAAVRKIKAAAPHD